MGRLTGKVAIITGAASGMGLAGAQLFAREGATVVATDLVEEVLQERVNEIAETGGDVIALKLDVSSPESWSAVVEETIKKFGKIDILVNNAGIHIAKGILEADLADWDKVMSINNTGVWLGMKAVMDEVQSSTHHPSQPLSAEYPMPRGQPTVLPKALYVHLRNMRRNGSPKIIYV
jgi:NAD(P)-dependent dehydrogenase (short-subunit alcohol dehydrogenase family)